MCINLHVCTADHTADMSPKALAEGNLDRLIQRPRAHQSPGPPSLVTHLHQFFRARSSRSPEDNLSPEKGRGVRYYLISSRKKQLVRD